MSVSGISVCYPLMLVMSRSRDSHEAQEAQYRSREAATGDALHIDEERLVRDDNAPSEPDSPLISLGVFGRDIVGFTPGEDATYLVFRDHVEVWPHE